MVPLREGGYGPRRGPEAASVPQRLGGLAATRPSLTRGGRKDAVGSHECCSLNDDWGGTEKEETPRNGAQAQLIKLGGGCQGLKNNTLLDESAVFSATETVGELYRLLSNFCSHLLNCLR
jgi:hypothetical protein